jgi:alkanesulfonate monooxygenase SsuD/methylene tetrahydromethanopterin reductase-like flavin-dependent oxidoreductase (luciferase family)
MANHGTDPDRRFGLMRERVEAMKAIWTQDEAEYHGRYVDFDPIWSWPKPAQEPHPPVVVGGNGRKVLDRVLAFGDEWMPNRVGDDDEFVARVDELQRRAEEAGRGPIPVTMYGASRKPDVLRRWAEHGVTRAVYWIPPVEAGEAERRMDEAAGFAEQYRAG